MPPRVMRKVQAGEKIKAADFNTLIENIAWLIGAVEGATGGAGIDVAVKPTGLVVALVDALKDRAVWAKIITAPAPGVPVLPSQCKYRLRGIDKKFDIEDVLPVYGRPCFGDEVHIYPDLVGNMAIILRNPQDGGFKDPQLFILGEHAVRGGCNTAGGG